MRLEGPQQSGCGLQRRPCRPNIINQNDIQVPKIPSPQPPAQSESPHGGLGARAGCQANPGWTIAWARTGIIGVLIVLAAAQATTLA